MTSKLLIASIVNALILFVVFVILKFSMVTTLDAAARMSIGVTWLGIQLLNVVLLGSFTFQHKRLGVSIKELVIQWFISWMMFVGAICLLSSQGA